MSKAEKTFILLAYCIGFLGVLQYIGVTSWLMSIYPGGRIGYRGSEGYDFFCNFLSDLGRTSAFGRGNNPTAPYYKATLATAGVATIVFFGALCHYLYHTSKNMLAIPCALLSIVAGVGYIGVAFYPINVDYHAHITYVQIGFIGFWWMSVLCAVAIWKSPTFPSKYARMIFVFLGILGLQIIVMLFGPRSWSSDGALVLQVTAQKIVVYSELLVMLILNIAAIGVLLKNWSRQGGDE